MSSLWRTERPRFPLYLSDGRGRDYYISYNNGGYWDSQFHIFKKPDYIRQRYSNFYTLFHPAAPFKYWGNGNGRETYILFANGLFKNPKSLASYKLSDFLRNSTSPSGTQKNIYLSCSEKKYNKKLRELEKDLVNRLYKKQMKKNKKLKINNEDILSPEPDKKKYMNTISSFPSSYKIKEENKPKNKKIVIRSLNKDEGINTLQKDIHEENMEDKFRNTESSNRVNKKSKNYFKNDFGKSKSLNFYKTIGGTFYKPKLSSEYQDSFKDFFPKKLKLSNGDKGGSKTRYCLTSTGVKKPFGIKIITKKLHEDID
jgi:hypothetical protein